MALDAGCCFPCALTQPMRLIVLTFPALAALMAAASESGRIYPLLHKGESVEQYARRANLPPNKTLDLGNGVKLELVLIPAGSFLMGTPEQPEPSGPDEMQFATQRWVGQAALVLSAGFLLVMLTFVVVRAIREKRRLQVSLARLVAMAVIAGAGLLGWLHWQHTTKALSKAKMEYASELVRYNASLPEKPAHEVMLTQAFYMGKYEVLQEQYQEVMGINPSQFKGRDLPVECVSWKSAQVFCKKASEITRFTIRLPSEAEWEYGCRAGTSTAYCSGDAEADLETVGWYSRNSGFRTHAAGQKTPNAWGMYDTHGNVSEWCADDMHDNYKGAFADGTAWVDSPRGTDIVWRGGSWPLHSRCCWSAYRSGFANGFGSPAIGFRVVCNAPANQ